MDCRVPTHANFAILDMSILYLAAIVQHVQQANIAMAEQDHRQWEQLLAVVVLPDLYRQWRHITAPRVLTGIPREVLVLQPASRVLSTCTPILLHL